MLIHWYLRRFTRGYQACQDQVTLPSMTEIVKQGIMRFSSETIELPCEWQNCSTVETHMCSYVNHILANHLATLDADNFHCQWRDCEGFTDTLEELRRHILYHAFHVKIKCYGRNFELRNNLPKCCLGSSGRNMIPEIPEPFACIWTDCQAIFENPEYFYRHVDSHSETGRESKPRKNPKCLWSGCNKEFQDPYKLRDHLRSHTQEKMIACPTCGGMFASRTKFLEHIQRQTLITEVSNTYTCEICARKMATKRLLRDHMRLHVNHYKCPCCDMTCPTPSALETHLSYRHSDSKPHSCQYCDYKCKRHNDLRKHLETHSVVPTLLCPHENCEYSARSQASYKKHIRSSHKVGINAKYSCHLCSKITTRGNYLTKHLISKHNFCWPSGHCRFRYHQQTDGFYRLQTIRLESLELSEAVLCDDTVLQSKAIDNHVPQAINELKTDSEKVDAENLNNSCSDSHVLNAQSSLVDSSVITSGSCFKRKTAMYNILSNYICSTF